MNLYSHLHRLGLRFYSAQRLGEITSRLTNDVVSVRNADRILVLEKGQIVESSTHESLIQSGGLYKRLYDIQFNFIDPTGEERFDPGELIYQLKQTKPHFLRNGAL